MFQSSSNNPTISPNLLSNFDPFAILQPEKVLHSNNGPEVALLIDFNDSSANMEFNASLLDKKTNYSVIDLFQNMYVTPHHVNVRAEPTTSNIDTTNIYTKDFIDKLESRENIYDNDKDEINIIKLTKEPKVLVPIVLKDDSDPEDVIDEVLSRKNIEKRILDEIKATTTANITHSTKISNAPIKLPLSKIRANAGIQDAQPKQMDIDVKAELDRLKLNNSAETDKNVQHNMKVDGQINNTPKFKVVPIKKDEKLYKKKRTEKPISETCRYIPGADIVEKSIVLPQIMARIQSRQANLEKKESYTRKFILDEGTEWDTVYKKSNVAEAKKGNKLDQDRPTSTPVNTVTKLREAKNYCGDYTTDGFGELSPIVLMADCNRERLKDCIISKMFKDYVMNGK